MSALEAVFRDPRTRRGIALLQAGHWYEAHEVLEGPWREQPRGSEARECLQALIQGAVSLEHLRRGNPRGALGQWRKARARLSRLPDQAGGLDLAGWRAAMDAFHARIDLAGRARRAPPDPRARGPLPPGLPDPATWPVPRPPAAPLPTSD